MNYPKESDSPRLDLVDQKDSSDSTTSSGGSGGSHGKRIAARKNRLAVCPEAFEGVATGTTKLTIENDKSIGERPKKKTKLDEASMAKKSNRMPFMDQIEYTAWLLFERRIFPENEQRMMTRVNKTANTTNSSNAADVKFEEAALAAINANNQEALEVLLHEEYVNKKKSATTTTREEQDESTTMVIGRLFLQACKHGHTDIVKFLLEGEEWNLPPTVQDDHGSTPLHYACRAAAKNKKSDCLVLLLGKYNCWPQLCLSDHVGRTPLEYLDDASWEGLYHGFLAKKSNYTLKNRKADNKSPSP